MDSTTRADPDDPVCFGCTAGRVERGRRRPNRAKWLVGDRQGHVTVECDMHAELILTRGDSWAIPLGSLCVVTNARTIGDALADAALSDEAETLGNTDCPTYARGFSVDLQRR